MRSVAVVVGALTALAGQGVQGPAASAESDRGRDADLAAIEKLHQQDIAALHHWFVCRIAGWRAEADSWHGARGAQEATGRQLERLPRDGDHRMSLPHRWS